MSTSSKFTAQAGQSVLLHDDNYILMLKTVNAETTFITGFKWFVGTAAQADAKILELKLKVKPAQ
jgi:hypothetical protein